jgi:hypothetical protein
MALFAVISLQSDSVALGTAIETHFAGKNFVVAPGHWVISTADATAMAISEILGMKGGAVGRAVVYNVAGYYGFAPTPLWEWLKANGSPAGG